MCKTENIKRIRLLSDDEINDLYSLPNLNAKEHDLYLTLNNKEYEIIDSSSNDITWIYFVLQLGYFKAKQQFYLFKLEDVKDDLEYILKIHNIEGLFEKEAKISKTTIAKQRDIIAEHFGYTIWSINHKEKILKQLIIILKSYPKKQNALRQLLEYFDNINLTIPSYRVLQDIFTEAYASEENRWHELVNKIPSDVINKLDHLLSKDNKSLLNLLKSEQKDFQFTAVREEVEKLDNMQEIYDYSKDFLPLLGISFNASAYYFDLIEHYSSSIQKRVKKPTIYIHLLCFIHHKYKSSANNLITSFVYHFRGILEESKVFIEAEKIKHLSKITIDLPKVAAFLSWFPKRGDELSFTETNDAAYNILPKEQFPIFAEHLAKSKFDKKKYKWKYYSQSSRMLSLYLRPIILNLEFKYFDENDKITPLINILKFHYNQGKPPATFKISDDLGLIIPKNIYPYLKKKPNDIYMDPYLFEYYVYEKMYHAIHRGKLFCNDSTYYCDIDQDLISEELVDKAEEFALQYGYNKIPKYCTSRLDELLSELNQAWHKTIYNIEHNENPGIKLIDTSDEQCDWQLLYDSSEKTDDSFFSGLPKIPISDIVKLIGDLTEMWQAFDHIRSKYVKKEQPVEIVLIACILSEAFGVGASKMGEMSDIDSNVLASTRKDFIRIDTLCIANDIVNNYVNSLAIFKLWNLLDDKLLADADGQKYATTESSIQSRYSKKYLGRGKGISIMSLTANNITPVSKNIGLNEYEGHSLFDMLYSNKTDIMINSITGDNHTLNKLNFLALDAINISYLPSIKNIKEATDDLYSVDDIENYNSIIQPEGKINVKRIKDQERGILRVLLSLIMQENTQTNIIRKINSHARYARLKAGLFEYNKIFKSIHVLNCVDDMYLRKALRTARNRTESYHQMHSVIRKMYHSLFRGRKIVSNRISAHASRLVSNCIIAYNATILNDVYLKLVNDNLSNVMIEKFARISPIAWSHILFTGRYNFTKSDNKIDLALMAKMLEQNLKDNLFVS